MDVTYERSIEFPIAIKQWEKEPMIVITLAKLCAIRS